MSMFKGIHGSFAIAVILITIPLLVPRFESQTTVQSAQLPTSQIDPEVYYGVQHIVDDNGSTHGIVVDLNDPHVRVQPVLSSGSDGECSSVNSRLKDPTSNCPFPYPFETLSSMLSRYTASGAVAIINTDYFGPDGDHGVEGLAVRNGVRLDGPAHESPYDGNATRRSSLAFSASKSAIIGKPTSETQIDTRGPYYNVVGGGPVIVREKTALDNSACREDFLDPSICTNKSRLDKGLPPAQSSAGLTSDGRLVLVTAQKDAAGIANYLATNFSVHTAMKFDGGGSARLAWLDSSGQIQSWGATSEDRPVGEGLLIFSERISTSTKFFTVDTWPGWWAIIVSCSTGNVPVKLDGNPIFSTEPNRTTRWVGKGTHRLDWTGTSVDVDYTWWPVAPVCSGEPPQPPPTPPPGDPPLPTASATPPAPNLTPTPSLTPPPQQGVTVISAWPQGQTVSQGQTFNPEVVVQTTGFSLNCSQDFLQSIDDNRYGTWPTQGCVDIGNNRYRFYFNTPMTAPGSPGTYHSRWKVWHYPNLVGPEIDLWFTIGQSPPPPQGWHIQYFNGTDLRSPCYDGYEEFTYIYKNWGDGTPAPACPNDNCKFAKYHGYFFIKNLANLHLSSP